jgi:hypothetical protein
LAPVSGTVRYNGKPLANAYVGFKPEEYGARSAMGTTDQNGQYRLTTLEPNDGARVGRHRVVVSAIEKPQFVPAPDGDAIGPDGSIIARPPGKLLTPARYGDFSTSGLTADVVARTKNVFDFELTD